MKTRLEIVSQDLGIIEVNLERFIDHRDEAIKGDMLAAYVRIRRYADAVTLNERKNGQVPSVLTAINSKLIRYERSLRVFFKFPLRPAVNDIKRLNKELINDFNTYLSEYDDIASRLARIDKLRIFYLNRLKNMLTHISMSLDMWTYSKSEREKGSQSAILIANLLSKMPTSKLIGDKTYEPMNKLKVGSQILRKDIQDYLNAINNPTSIKGNEGFKPLINQIRRDIKMIEMEGNVFYDEFAGEIKGLRKHRGYQNYMPFVFNLATWKMEQDPITKS